MDVAKYLRKELRHRHFLSHTVEHILGVFFVLAIATTVGYIASADSASTTPSGTDTSSTTSGSTNTIGTSDTIPPTSPLLHLGNVYPNEIDLYWDGATDNVGVVGYEFYKNGTLVQRTTDKSYKDSSDLQPGTMNAYYVIAVDAAGNRSMPSDTNTVQVPFSNGGTSTTSSSDTVPPTPPNLIVTSVTSGSVTLSWNGAADNVGISGYKLFRNGQFFVGITDGSANSYTDSSGIAPGTVYYYFIKSADSAMNESMPSNTVTVNIPTQTTTSPPPPPSPTTSPPPETTTLKTVSFSVTAAPVPDCSGSQPMTQVLFMAQSSDGSGGGAIALTSDSGKTENISSGQRPNLPNGKYSWTGVPQSGYTVTAPGSGDLELNAVCPSLAQTASTPTQPAPVPSTTAPSPLPALSTTTIPPPPLVPSVPRPVLKIFLDNKPVTDQGHVFGGTDVELRLSVQSAKKVHFYAFVPNGTTPLDLGIAVLDDLLSTATNGVWTDVWNTRNAKDGQYKIFGRILFTNGTTADTAPFLVAVKSDAQLAEGSGDQTATGSSDVDVKKEQRTAILARVNEPSACGNALECKVYCESHPDEHERCVDYARSLVASTSPNTPLPSLADGIPTERLTAVLENPDKRSHDLPSTVSTTDEFKDYCRDESHADLCGKVIVANDLANQGSVNEKKTAMENADHAVTEIFAQRVGARPFIDSDGDGISDYDEVNIYHTDPNDPDTDHDGFPDGEEILAHTNPLGGKMILAPINSTTTAAGSSTSLVASPASEEVRLEDPLITGNAKPDLLTVANVSVAATGEDEKGSTTAKTLLLTGKALPNSFVTIYIYSTPIVVSVKTDETGAWTYTLDKELPDGSHQVVSAITDAGGHILAKSDPLPFVKVAAAVSVGSEDLIAPSAEAPGFFSGASLYALIAIIVGILGIAFSILGFVAHRKGPDDAPPMQMN